MRERRPSVISGENGRCTMVGTLVSRPNQTVHVSLSRYYAIQVDSVTGRLRSFRSCTISHRFFSNRDAFDFLVSNKIVHVNIVTKLTKCVNICCLYGSIKIL